MAIQSETSTSAPLMNRFSESGRSVVDKVAEQYKHPITPRMVDVLSGDAFTKIMEDPSRNYLAGDKLSNARKFELLTEAETGALTYDQKLYMVFSGIYSQAMDLTEGKYKTPDGNSYKLEDFPKNSMIDEVSHTIRTNGGGQELAKNIHGSYGDQLASFYLHLPMEANKDKAYKEPSVEKTIDWIFGRIGASQIFGIESFKKFVGKASERDLFNVFAIYDTYLQKVKEGSAPNLIEYISNFSYLKDNGYNFSVPDRKLQDLDFFTTGSTFTSPLDQGADEHQKPDNIAFQIDAVSKLCDNSVDKINEEIPNEPSYQTRERMLGKHFLQDVKAKIFSKILLDQDPKPLIREEVALRI